MRNKLFFMLALPFVLAACSKSTSPEPCYYTPTTAVAPAAERAALRASLDQSFIQDPSGICYKIVAQGAGAVPEVCSDVTVKYSGRITSSDIPFDKNETGVTFKLGGLIPGWQIGIPLIQKGGSIILYIPPSLGYGSTGAGNGAIPPGSYLVFTIDLLNVQ
jgi:FKBP-type peptidyl-prolyl cis-trans isomerase FkpA